jgi:hypothetical protein
MKLTVTDLMHCLLTEAIQLIQLIQLIDALMPFTE